MQRGLPTLPVVSRPCSICKFVQQNVSPLCSRICRQSFTPLTITRSIYSYHLPRASLPPSHPPLPSFTLLSRSNLHSLLISRLHPSHIQLSSFRFTSGKCSQFFLRLYRFLPHYFIYMVFTVIMIHMVVGTVIIVHGFVTIAGLVNCNSRRCVLTGAFSVRGVNCFPLLPTPVSSLTSTQPLPHLFSHHLLPPLTLCFLLPPCLTSLPSSSLIIIFHPVLVSYPLLPT